MQTEEERARVLAQEGPIREFRVSKINRYQVTEWTDYRGAQGTRVIADDLTLDQANQIATSFGEGNPGSLVNTMESPFEGSIQHLAPSDEERVARICHEVNRAWCEYGGDTSQPTWEDAPQWQRDSAINGVLFHRANPGAGDSASHDSWMAEKVAAGWVYGNVKDPEAKTHPCIVPFDQLPRDQQFKDRLFRTVVHAT